MLSVDDLISGMISLMNSQHNGPVNFGNPNEITIKELAKLIINKINPTLEIIYKELPEDDPLKRKPDINIAKRVEMGAYC